jgi:hypothetical protein
MRTSVLAVAMLAISCGGRNSDRCTESIDDADACTIDSCDSSTGTVTHTLVGINDADVCTVDSCDPATGAVTHPAALVDDRDACTVDACSSLTGVTHAALDVTATAILSGSPSGSLHTWTIPSSTNGGVSVCPGGADLNANPPTCVAGLDFAAAALTFERVTNASYSITGSVPVRIQKLPVQYSGLSGSVTLSENGACPPAPQTFLFVPVTITFVTNAETGTALDVDTVLDETTVRNGLFLCDTSLALFFDLIRSPIASEITRVAEEFVSAQVESELCIAGPDCPEGTTEDPGGLCRYPSGLCVARGTDSGTGMLIVPACFQ